MLKFLISFSIGLYAGLYVDQNYKIPNVSDPESIYNAVVKWSEKFRKGDGK